MDTEKEKTNELTLAECIKAVNRFAGNYVDMYFGEEDPKGKETPVEAYERLKQVLDLNSDRQVELFSVIVENSMCSRLTASELAERLGASKVELLAWKPELEYLASKRYVLYNQKRLRYTSFLVPEVVIDAIANNRRPNKEDLSGMNVFRFVNQLDSIYRCFYENEIDFGTLCSEVDVLYASNQGNELVMAYNSYNLDEELDNYEKLLLSFMICRNMCHAENRFEWPNYARLFLESELRMQIKATIENGGLVLQEKGIVEFDCSDGFEHQEYICLSKNALKQFLGECENTVQNISRGQNQGLRLIAPDQITSKQLFYNEKIKTEVDRLTNLMKPDNYNQLVGRLEEMGMRRGFACLFYGAPGTGKTETVNQLARMTGRSIFAINVPDIKSKWVGESEKNIKATFDRYRSLVRQMDVAPILLFNEADGICGIRKEGATSAAEKMENAIQNIILQEMETLDGIMIATTNLTQNLDPAFERRFLYKICFEKPDMQVRKKIWAQMIPSLSDQEYDELARYDLSGGQMENVTRRSTIRYILEGQKPDLDYLRELCVSERMDSGTTSTHIGF